VLDAAFTNLTAAALHHPSSLPFRMLPVVRDLLVSRLAEKWNSLERIGGVSHPILVMHGRRDRMMPFFIGHKLYETARLGRLRDAPDLLEDLWFSEFPHAGHNDVYSFPQWAHDLDAFTTAMERRGGGPAADHPEECVSA
jgi:pimeloyl-ACP methyl ester carboxylesterase